MIVHCVEKFIQKSASEYKLAGLYVIDSIVRASSAKDLEYTSRFQKNLPSIFPDLLNAPKKDMVEPFVFAGDLVLTRPLGKDQTSGHVMEKS
jgi:hypothetical protein